MKSPEFLQIGSVLAKCHMPQTEGVRVVMKYQKKKFYAGIQILIIKNIINLWKMWEDVYIIVAV